MPVAFLVSDPRLWATVGSGEIGIRWRVSTENKILRTPGDDDPDRCVGPARDAERRKVADVVVLGDCEQ